MQSNLTISIVDRLIVFNRYKIIDDQEYSSTADSIKVYEWLIDED